MRIRINFSPNTEVVPINNQNIVNSYTHNCLGRNNPYHDAMSDYSVSMLCGGKLNDDKVTLSFSKGSYLIISSIEPKFITTFLKGVINNKTLGYGMEYVSYEYVNEEINDGWNYFSTLSPFLIVKDKTAIGRDRFLLLDSKNFETEVKTHLMRRLNAISQSKGINVDLTDFDVKIPNHPNHKIKKIYLHKSRGNHVDVTKNYANACRVNIFSSKKVAEILYNVGIGQSCGSGFGVIYKNENKSFYNF